MTKRRANGEGCIDPLPNGTWRGRVTIGYKNGKQQRISITRKTRADVNRQIRKIKLELEKGSRPSNTRILMRDYLPQWLAVKRDLTRLAPRTIHSYDDTIRNHLAPRIGHIRLTALTTADVNNMMTAMLKDGVKGPSVVYARRVLRAALNHALREGDVPQNVAKLSIEPKITRMTVHPFTQEHALRFALAVREDRLEALYLLAITTGMRQGEILGLIWEDIDFETQSVTVSMQLQRVDNALVRRPLKTEKSQRTISLSPLAIEALKRQRTKQKEARLRAGRQWQETPYVFTSGNGTPLIARNLVRHFKDVLARIITDLPAEKHLPDYRFHALRHSAATIMHAMGLSLKEIQEALGHADIRTTSNTYTEIFAEQTRRVADAMDNFFTPKQAEG